MVVIDKARCTGCGSCVGICHEHCMALSNRKVTIEHALCSTCTQCIAICPNKALSWDGVVSLGYDDDLLPSADQILELLRERRTTRDFTDERLSQETLDELASVGVYAPTHNFRLRCIIVDDVSMIDAFDKAVLDFSQRVYALIFRPRLFRALVGLASLPIREELTRARPKLEAARERGRGFKSRPAALILVIGDKRVPLSLESAQYALYNMTLLAQTKGLGCQNLVGNQMIFNRSKAIRRHLGLARSERVFAVMGVGRPAVRFRNKPAGKIMSIQWNGGGEN